MDFRVFGRYVFMAGAIALFIGCVMTAFAYKEIEVRNTDNDALAAKYAAERIERGGTSPSAYYAEKEPNDEAIQTAQKFKSMGIPLLIGGIVIAFLGFAITSSAHPSVGSESDSPGPERS